MQFHFRSAKIFSRAFFGAGPSPIQVAVDCFFFTSLQQTQEKLFVFIFIDKLFSTLRLQHVSRAFIFET